jgi:hypothetical protein
MITGHDWRRAIGPRQGYYLRCRRCWITEHEEAKAEAHAPPSDLRSSPLQRQH